VCDCDFHIFCAFWPKDTYRRSLHPLSLGDICHAALMYISRHAADGAQRIITTDLFGGVIGHGKKFICC